MKGTELEQVFKETFDFLKIDYGFSTILSKKEKWGYFFVAANATTGIEIKYEFKEAFIQIVIYRLVNGKIVKNITNAIKNNEPITGFSLEWILALKNQEAQIKPVYEYGIKSTFYEKENGFKNYASIVAERLKEYASDILKGDFSVFDDLDIMIKENYKNYHQSRKQ
jgi:predicted small secreted protein